MTGVQTCALPILFTQIFPWLQAIEGYIFKRPVMTPDLPETICFKGSRVLRTLDQEHVDRLFEELSAEAHKENDCYLIQSDTAPHMTFFKDGKWTDPCVFAPLSAQLTGVELSNTKSHERMYRTVVPAFDCDND